jgi:hypothetical protein
MISSDRTLPLPVLRSQEWCMGKKPEPVTDGTGSDPDSQVPRYLSYDGFGPLTSEQHAGQPRSQTTSIFCTVLGFLIIVEFLEISIGMNWAFLLPNNSVTNKSKLQFFTPTNPMHIVHGGPWKCCSHPKICLSRLAAGQVGG